MPTPAPFATPFGPDGALAPAFPVDDDVFAQLVEPITREVAMSVPAHARARALVCVPLARQPIIAKRWTGQLDAAGNRIGEAIAEQPRWLYHSDIWPVRLRTLWTLDDLAHYGWSLWALERGDVAEGRAPILDAWRVPWNDWKFDKTGHKITARMPDGDGVYRDRELRDGEYLLFPGIVEGMLTSAADTLRDAKRLERRASERTANPLPHVEIRYTGEEDLEPAEMKDIRDKYIAARNDENGTVMVTPRGFEIHATGGETVELFVTGRNAKALDIARFWNIAASMLDASAVNGSSVNYENMQINRTGYADVTLRSWALPIEEVLSQDDVLPGGTYAEFDLSALTVGPDTGTGPTLED